MKTLHTLLILLTGIPAHAAEDKKPAAPADCAVERKEIAHAIDETAACFNDEECTYAHRGCPFENNPCEGSPISLEEKKEFLELDRKVSDHVERCVKNNPELTKRCQKYDEDKKKMKCSTPPRLLCYNGRCVNQTRVYMDTQELIEEKKNEKKKEKADDATPDR